MLKAILKKQKWPDIITGRAVKRYGRPQKYKYREKKLKVLLIGILKKMNKYRFSSPGLYGEVWYCNMVAHTEDSVHVFFAYPLYDIVWKPDDLWGFPQ